MSGNQPLINYFRGPIRKRGSGIGSLVLQVTRHVLPILAKYVYPRLNVFEKCLRWSCCPNLLMLPAEGPTQKAPSSALPVKQPKKQLGRGGGKKRKVQKRSSKKMSAGSNSTNSRRGNKTTASGFSTCCRQKNDISQIYPSFCWIEVLDKPKRTTHSSLILFSKPEVLVTFDNSFERDFARNFLQCSSCKICADNRLQHLFRFAKHWAQSGSKHWKRCQLQQQLKNRGCRCRHCANSWWQSCLFQQDISLVLFQLWRIDQIVHTSGNLYAQRAFIETELSPLSRLRNIKIGYTRLQFWNHHK